MKSTLKKALSLALSLTLTISLAACGSSGNTTPSTDPAASGGSADSGDLSRIHLKVGGQIRQTSLYLYYARDMGLFEDAGLDVEVVTLASGPAINEAMTAGELDIACSGVASVYILGTGRFTYVFDTTINSGGQSMYARADSDIVKAGNYNGTNLIGSPDTVKGATMIGLFASTAQYNAIAYAEAMGLTAEDVNLVNMDHAQGYQAFISGEGDILSTTPPYSSMLDADPNYVMVADMPDLMDGAPLVDSLVVTNELDENYHDVVVAFAECCFEAMDQLAKDDELRAEYATNLYLNEGGVTYSEEDMAAEIANVTYWTWEELENPPFEPGTTMRTMAQFFIDQGQIEADSLSNITDSLKYETYRTEILDYHNSH